MFDIYGFYEKLRTQNVVMSYQGQISEGLLTTLLELAETRLGDSEYDLRLRKRVFAILVELLQNIFHHMESDKEFASEYSTMIFLLIKMDDGYTIITGNHISNNRVPQLKSRIDKINNMSPLALKNNYRLRLGQEPMSKNGGAGLGILKMIRRSGEKISYVFKEINHKYSFFGLQVNVFVNNSLK